MQFALVYRIIAFIIAVTGFFVIAGVTQGAFNSGIMMYYTMQSNLIGIIMLGILVIKTIRDMRNNQSSHPGYYPQLMMVVSITLFITFLVFWVMLAPLMFTMTTDFDLWSFGNLAVHTYTPLLVLFDYVLFSPPRHLKYSHIYYIAIYPIAYLLFTTIAGFMGYVYFNTRLLTGLTPCSISPK